MKEDLGEFQGDAAPDLEHFEVLFESRDVQFGCSSGVLGILNQLKELRNLLVIGEVGHAVPVDHLHFCALPPLKLLLLDQKLHTILELKVQVLDTTIPLLNTLCLNTLQNNTLQQNIEPQRQLPLKLWVDADIHQRGGGGKHVDRQLDVVGGAVLEVGLEEPELVPVGERG